MANIATLLARILSTRYGNEMRQDLHDSIEAVNDDTETALGKSLAFTTNTRKLKLLAKDNTVLSEVLIPGGGSGGGSVDSVNGQFPDENGNVELNLDDINDVDITEVSDGDALVYDSTSHKWVNGAGGGGTSDYNNLTNKPSINGVTLSGNKTSSDLGISGGSNENILLNPWFNVNTKGFTSGTALAYYSKECIDSWFGEYDYPADSSGTLTYNSNGSITVTPSYNEGYSGMVGITQLVKNKNELYGKTITLSVLINGSTLLSTSGVFTQGSGISNYHLLFGNNMRASLTFSDSNGKFSIRVGREDNTQSGESSVVINAVKLEVGSVSTLLLDIKPNQNLETVKCNGVMRSNRNLLDNPWFTINQKGFTSGSIATIGESVPFIDRWKGNYQVSATSSISLSNNQLTLTVPAGVGCGFGQGSEILQSMTSGKATVSVMFADNTVMSKEITLSSTPTVYDIGTYNGLKVDYRHYASLNAFTFVFTNNGDSQKSVTVKAVKFELGSESTLALDTAPDYASELLKCQRYYYPLSGKEYLGFKTSNYEVKVPLPTEMRTTPSISLTGSSAGLTGSSQQGGSISSATVSVSGNEALVNVGLTMAGGGADYNVYSAFEIFNLVGYLSAEL